MRPAFGGAGTPAMRRLPRLQRLPCRLLLCFVVLVAALVELMNLCQLAACLAPRGSSNGLIQPPLLASVM